MLHKHIIGPLGCVFARISRSARRGSSPSRPRPDTKRRACEKSEEEKMSRREKPAAHLVSKQRRMLAGPYVFPATSFVYRSWIPSACRPHRYLHPCMPPLLRMKTNTEILNAGRHCKQVPVVQRGHIPCHDGGPWPTCTTRL
jgi:hypothetical protein